MSKPILLVVEDHPVTQKVITLLCDEYGFGLVLAGTCDEAIAAIAESHVFALVLLDLKLPDRAGHEAVPEMRAAIKDRRIPIIAMSGLIDYAQRKAEIGVDDFLCKPFSAQEFQSMVLKWTSEGHNIVQFPSDDDTQVEAD